MIEIKKQEFTKPLIIAGPCSAESQEQLLATAKGLEDKATILGRVYGSPEHVLIHSMA